jgi:hypothetical protein
MMEILSRLGLCMLLIAIYGMIAQLLPDNIEAWRLSTIAVTFNLGIVLYLISSFKGKDN